MCETYIFNIHVSLERSTNINRLAIVSTHSSVREGQVTFILVVNFTGNLIKIKRNLKLGESLLYDRTVVPNPLEFPTALTPLTLMRDKGPFSYSAVKVADYPDHKPSLTELLRQHRNVFFFFRGAFRVH